MPLIELAPHGKDVSLSLTLPEETANDVKLYARFLKATHQSAVSNIITECIRRTLKQDTEFQTWKSDPVNTKTNRGGARPRKTGHRHYLKQINRNDKECDMNSASIHPGFRLILPYLRQIENLILDPEISEIMINSPSDIFIEKQGVMERVLGVTIPTDQLRVAVQNIARSLGDDISEEKPILDSRLPDGSRIAAVLPPCSIHGITLTIRKFNIRNFTIADLIRIGTITEEMAAYLQAAIAGRKNILISGGTGTGKTTLLNILADFIPDEDRLLVIEDTAEIHIRKPNLVRFEARRQQGPKIPAVTIRDLLKASLRHRPERTILGEIRGEEAFDLSGTQYRSQRKSFDHPRQFREPSSLPARQLRAAKRNRTALQGHQGQHRGLNPSPDPHRAPPRRRIQRDPCDPELFPD